MMSKKQQIARANFKKAIKEAQALRKKNPKLTQSEALKKAFAANKKVAPKRLGNLSKDIEILNSYSDQKIARIYSDIFDIDYTDLIIELKGNSAERKNLITDILKSGKKIGAYKVVEKSETKLTKPKATYQVVRAKKGTYKGIKKIAGSHNFKNSKSISITNMDKVISGMLRKYVAVFDFQNGTSDYEIFQASSLQEAKKYAQFYKRKENIKGKVSVKLIKK